MRVSSFLFASLLAISLIGGAQNSDRCVSIKENGNEVTIRAESWDPVAAVGRTLAYRYGIRLSVESPNWEFPGDTEDVAVANPEFSVQHGNIHYAVMKRHGIQVQFSTTGSGRPSDVAGLLRQVADAANTEMPYAYRLDVSGDDYALVPTKTRNSSGELEDVVPLLDRKVTISLGTRTIARHADLMADQLSKQTGLHVSCCSGQVPGTGIPWGMAEIKFEADNKPAREVLRSLMLAESQANSQSPIQHPDDDHWVVGCDGTGAPWCFIGVESNFSTPLSASQK